MRRLTLTRLNTATQIADGQGRAHPSFVQNLNNALDTISQTVDANADFVDQIVALNGLITSVETAATTAQSAAASAQSTASSAATTASSATSQIAAQARLVALMGSFTVPQNVLTASSDTATATVLIAGHQRQYANGSAVSISSGSIGGLALSTTYYVYYNDSAHTGGSVSYIATTTATNAAQIGATHCVGKITTPAASSTSNGTGSAGPGVPL